MIPRLTILTLGVKDPEAARAFYTGLGLTVSEKSQGDMTILDMNGLLLALYPFDKLAEDATLEAPAELPAFRGLTLAWNLSSEAEVDAAVAQAEAAGATVVKRPQKVFWGGYSSYIKDPDGHLWELAYNPFMELDSDGRPTGY